MISIFLDSLSPLLLSPSNTSSPNLQHRHVTSSPSFFTMVRVKIPIQKPKGKEYRPSGYESQTPSNSPTSSPTRNGSHIIVILPEQPPPRLQPPSPVPPPKATSQSGSSNGRKENSDESGYINVQGKRIPIKPNFDDEIEIISSVPLTTTMTRSERIVRKNPPAESKKSEEESSGSGS